MKQAHSQLLLFLIHYLQILALILYKVEEIIPSFSYWTYIITVRRTLLVSLSLT